MTGESSGRSLSPAQLEQRRSAARSNGSHGARSPLTVSKGSAYRQQSLLKPLGLALTDLDPVTKRMVREWSLLAEQARLMDVRINERGWLDEEDRLPGFHLTYLAAKNSAQRRLRELEPRLIRIADEKHRGGSMVLRMQRNGKR